MGTSDGDFASKKYVDDNAGGPNTPRLDAYLSTNLNVVLETETIIQFDTTSKALGISVTAGEITFTDAGRYTGNVIINVDEDRDPETSIWLERKPFSTGVWELFDNMISVKIKDDGSFVLPGDCEVDAGDKVRVKIYFTKSDASLDLISASLVTALGTVSQPSASISVHRIGDKTP